MTAITDINRILLLLGGVTQASRIINKPDQLLLYVRSGRRRLNTADAQLLATKAADAAVLTYGLKASPFVRAWVAKALLGNSRVTLPRGFAPRRVML